MGALVPLAKMFFYAESLRLMSQGRATFTLTFDHYAPVSSLEDDPTFRPAMGMRVNS